MSSCLWIRIINRKVSVFSISILLGIIITKLFQLFLIVSFGSFRYPGQESPFVSIIVIIISFTLPVCTHSLHISFLSSSFFFVSLALSWDQNNSFSRKDRAQTLVNSLYIFRSNKYPTVISRYIIYGICSLNYEIYFQSYLQNILIWQWIEKRHLQVWRSIKKCFYQWPKLLQDFPAG